MSRSESNEERTTMNPMATATPIKDTLSRRAARMALVLACTLGALLALGAGPVGATVLHNSEGSFTAPGGSFGYLFAISVDNSRGNSSGDVYVGGLSSSNYSAYVYKFTAAGTYTGVELDGSKTPQGSFAFLSLNNFNGSRGLAVDVSAGANMGDVYLADAEHHVVDRFNENGEFLCEITGKEYAELSQAEQKAECAGEKGSKTPQSGFTEGYFWENGLGVAIDPLNGDVYVADPGHAVIDEFNEAGEYVGQIADPHITTPSSLAFNKSGELYVDNGNTYTGTSVVKFDAKGNFASVLDESSPGYVAVNPSNDRVYVFEGSEEQVAEYDVSGKLISTFARKQAGAGALGVSGASGRIYLGSSEGSGGNPVYMYSKAFVIPNVASGEASDVAETSATLRGEAEPDLAHGGGNVESCEFEYASKYTLDHLQSVSTTKAGAPGESFTFTLGFDRGFSQTGWRGAGRVASESTTVTEVLTSGEMLTSGAAPVVGEEISGPGIKPGTTIVYYSRSEHTIALSQQTEAVPAAMEAERQALRADLSGTAGAKLVQQALEVLPTIGAGNVAVSGPAGGPWRIEFTGALANATLPPLVARVTSANGVFYALGVEPDWAAASKASCEPSAPYSQPQSVTAKVTGLAPSMSYTYRLAAGDSEGSARGEGESFTTSGPPSIDRVAAEAKQTSVRLWAKINPFGSDATCQVQYVTDAAYRESQWASAANAPCERDRLGSGSDDLGSGMGGTEFPYATDAVAMAQAEGLARGTSYHYRFTATNQAGSTTREGTFETWGIRRFSVEELHGSRETRLGGNLVWEAGLPESPMQAGAHPYELVTTIDFSLSQAIHRCEEEVSCPSGHLGEEIIENGETLQNVKDIKVQLPPGMIGNPDNFPKCNAHVAIEKECPTDSQVGFLEYHTDYPMSQPDGFTSEPIEEREANGCRSYCLVPLYNLEPQHANPAEFANPGDLTKVQLPFEVRTGADYGITNNTVDIIAAAPVQQLRVRIWGVPGNAGHEVGRQMGCPIAAKEKCSPEQAEVPLLTNPTSCAGPQSVKASFDTWSEPGIYTSTTSRMEGFTGCDKLKFEPTFEAQPTSASADSPSGLHVDLHVPQDMKEGREDPNGLASADLKDAKVVLPAGMTVNPSSADGLEACSEQQMGFIGFEELDPRFERGVQTAQFTPEPASCPDGSKIGTVEIDSRLVDHPLSGGVYVAQQGANPFKSLLALYIALYDAPTGLVIKLPGEISTDPLTGQLTVTFDQNPQLPFEDFKMDLFPGERAALTTPLTCGSYQTATDLTPWSSPEGADANPLSAPFGLTAGCVTSEAQAPNAPTFEAGTASSIGASYSPFVLHLKREDGSQRFSAIDVTLPPGLTGKIAGVEECPQAAIDQARARSHEGEGALELSRPSCPQGSEVGTVHVGTGSGAPDYVSGHVYFAGPYEGAPFSLVFVTPAVAGPFDLGSVVVRAGIYIDPTTAQVTVKSDPLPTILDGIPLDIRSIGVDVNRSDFTLNPTSCAVMSVKGQETSTAGQSAPLSDRFQAGGCTTLPFDPSFKAWTSTSANPKEGAALIVRVGSGSGQANIGRVHVRLPEQLPSRLTTLQKACIDTVFDADPSKCPAESRVGEARATTPLLPVALSGPAYFVSHGGAAFPELIVVLSGDGVTVDLHGETYIEKPSNITTSTFPSVPDLPVSSFELKLPAGPYSALDANGDLCSQKLVMPTTITGQNGAQIEQQTPITVQGCKPEMRVLRHRVKGKRAIVVVSVPSAGTLIAGGKGLSHVRKVVRKAGIVTVSLRLSKAEQRFVARHHGRRLMAPIRLSFKPAHGGNLRATVAVLMR